MTAQVPDSVVLDGTVHSIAGQHGWGLFQPADHDIWPVMIHTGCWRGWIATYTVRDGRFRLAQLALGRGSTVGPAGATPPHGVPITEDTVVLGGRPVLDGGTWQLADLDVPVSFTGGLLLGQGFLSAHYVHMGFHPAWKFERVVELVAREGVVTELADRSAEVAAMRESIVSGAAPDPDQQGDLDAWVARTFTLGYGRTFGPGPAPPPP